MGGSTANFTNPAAFGNGQGSLTILDGGNSSFNPAAPFATPFEYCYYTTNTVGTNTISGLTRGVANTTPHSFLPGAIVAQGLLAEDIIGSVPWKFDDQTLGSAAASIVIPASGSIPSSYLGITWKHLHIRALLRSDQSGAGAQVTGIRFNGDTGNNYATQRFDAVGTTLAGAATTAGSFIDQFFIPTNGVLANVFGWVDIRINDFSSTTKVKTGRIDYMVWQGAALSGGNMNSDYTSFLWNSTAAITSVTIFPTVGDLLAGSEAQTELAP